MPSAQFYLFAHCLIPPYHHGSADGTRKIGMDRRIMAVFQFAVEPLILGFDLPPDFFESGVFFFTRHGNGKGDRKSTRLNSSHESESRMPSSA